MPTTHTFKLQSIHTIDVFAWFGRPIQRLIDPIVGQLLLRIVSDPLSTDLMLVGCDGSGDGRVCQASEGREGLCARTGAAILHDVTQLSDTFVETQVIVVNCVVVG